MRSGVARADRRVIAVADHEIVLHDAAERRQREKVRDHRRAVGEADVEDEAVAVDAEIEGIRPAVMAVRAETSFLR